MTYKEILNLPEDAHIVDVNTNVAWSFACVKAIP